MSESTSVKSSIGAEDVNFATGGSGTAETFTRLTSTGGTLSLNKIDASYIKYRNSSLPLESSATGDYLASMYGTLGTQAAIVAAITAIGSTNATLRLLPGTWSITSDITIPSNITLKPERGAILSIATTKTLTVNGDINAGLYQVFSCVGTGKVVFSSAVQAKTIWWGIDNTGATDVGAELAKISDALPAGSQLDFLPGTYTIFTNGEAYTYVLRWDSIDGLTINGNGATIALATGRTWSAGEYMGFLQFETCKNIEVKNFKGSGDDYSSIATSLGCEFVKFMETSMNLTVDNIHLDGGYRSAVSCFMADTLAGANSLRCENVRIGNIYAEQCTYGVQLHGACNVQIDNLKTNGCGRSMYLEGGKNIKANVYSKNPKLTEDVAMGIRKSAATGNMENVEINYYRGAESTACHASNTGVSIGFSNTGTGTSSTIRNVKINLDVEYAGSGTTGTQAFKIYKTDAAGDLDTEDHGWLLENLELTGTVKGDPSSADNILMNLGYSCNWGVTVADGTDYWRNIRIKNFYTNSTKAAYGSLRALHGELMILDGVKSAANWIFDQNQSAGTPQDIGRIEFINCSIPNLWIDYTAGSTASCLQLIDIGTDKTLAATATSSSRYFTNRVGGGASVTFTLPAATVGLEFNFIRMGAGALIVDPNGTETIGGGGAGKNISLDTNNACVKLKCIVAGNWAMFERAGTITAES